MIKNLEYVATQLSSPQLGCVYFLFFMVRNISLWFSGLLVCTLSHVLWLYRIQKVNYDALRLVWTFFFFFLTRKCFAIKHLSKHIFCVHYVVLWASCLKMITKKILFNYSWCDRYHVWRKSLEKRNRHCPLLFRMISLWKMQFLFPLKKKLSLVIRSISKQVQYHSYWVMNIEGCCLGPQNVLLTKALCSDFKWPGVQWRPCSPPTQEVFWDHLSISATRHITSVCSQVSCRLSQAALSADSSSLLSTQNI